MSTPSPSVNSEMAGPAESRACWLVSPWFDLLFVANIGWPLVLLAQLWGGLDTHEGIRFWQVYFVTTPHRWITLPLVFLDGERFRQRSRAFVGVAVCAVLFCLGVRLSTGTLVCLLTIDYIWNAWHFASQHHGIYRIYGRLSDPQQTSGLTAEKIAMRTFLVYVAARVAGWSWAFSELDWWLARLDWVLIAVPAWMLAGVVLRSRAAAPGRTTYLLSVLTLYLSMLFAVHFQRPRLLLMLTIASALFHAVEYLAVVGWAVGHKHDPAKGARTLFSRFVPRWGLVLATFALIIGLGGRYLEQELLQFWLLLNVIVAFLHYAYDGMIWKTRRSGSYAK